MFENKITGNYKTIIFVLMLILMIAFIGRITDIAVMFFGAFIIASSALPAINKIKKFMPRALAVVLILLLVLAGILVIFIPLSILLVNKIAAFVSEIPQYIVKFDVILAKEFFGHTLNEYISLNGFEKIGHNLDGFAGNVLSSGLTVGKVIGSSITSIFVVTLMVFYLCMDEEHMKKAYLSFFPPKFKEKAANILDILTAKVGGYVVAQILSMAAVGILTLIGLLIIKHPQAVLIGFLTFILDLIPVVGATIAVTTGTLAAASMGFGYMMLVLAIMLLAQWAQNQILRPVLFGKFMDIHPLLIIVSLLVGAKFLGFAGVVLGPAFACLICVLVNELYIKQINK